MSILRISYLLLVILLLSCSDNDLLQSEDYQSPVFTISDIPITVGSFWKYKVEGSNITGGSYTTVLKIEKVDSNSLDTVKIHYFQYSTDTRTNEEFVIDSAIGVLTKGSFTYYSLNNLSKFELKGDTYFGEYRLELPFGINKRWVSTNQLDTLRVMYYAEKLASTPLLYSKVLAVYQKV